MISDYFRVFDNMEEGVKGYFELLQLPRYQNLKGITEPRRYLETIWADGYATSSVYVQKNMELIEQYQLMKYDENASGRSAQEMCIRDRVYGTFWSMEDDYTVEPYIRVAAGDYLDLCDKWGKDSALTAILLTICLLYTSRCV